MPPGDNRGANGGPQMSRLAGMPERFWRPLKRLSRVWLSNKCIARTAFAYATTLKPSPTKCGQGTGSSVVSVLIVVYPGIGHLDSSNIRGVWEQAAWWSLSPFKIWVSESDEDSDEDSDLDGNSKRGKIRKWPFLPEDRRSLEAAHRKVAAFKTF